MFPEEGASEFELRDFLRVLRRRRDAIFVAVLVVVGAAMAASFLQTPVYRAEGQLLLQPRSTESLFDPETGQRNQAADAVDTEIAVLTSKRIRDEVAGRIGSAPDISVTQLRKTDVVEIGALSTDPGRAARVANTYANAYIDLRRKAAVDDLLAAAKEIEARVVDLQRQIDALGSPSTGPGGVVVDPQAPRRASLLQQQALFKQKLDEVQVDAALKTGAAQLVTAATPPTSPVKPTPLRTGALALAVGAVLGVGAAFLFEYLDDSVKTKDELERLAPELPTLGLIPEVTNWKDPQRPVLASLHDSTSPVAEAYRSLRTAVQFMGLDRALRVLQVTSPAAGEGKTTTLANLGLALAQAGQRVAVVSCDLRRPRVHEFYGLSNDVGFTSVLLGDVPLSLALQTLDGQDRLTVLASGPIPPNPAELLGSARAGEVLAALAAESDIVLLDCPPVLPVTDAAVLSTQVDAILMVVNVGHTTRREFSRAHELMRQLEAPIIGTVLNGVTSEATYDYSYGYRYAPAQTGERPPLSANGRGRRGARTRA